MRRVILVALILSACTSPEPDPSPPGVSAQPYDGGAGRLSPLADGRYRVWPDSEPAEPGVPYRFSIYVHCGIDFLLDFDGNFWELDSSTPPISPGPLPENTERGTMRLLSEDLAEFRGTSGLVARFNRVEGPKDVGLCS